MNKSPAFQFYPADFLADENVILMDNRQIGCYVKLMCICWRQGSIPDSLQKIAKLCGEDDAAMAELWQGIEPCFKTDTEGRLKHPRLEKEMKKQENFRKSKSAAGRKGAASRWHSHSTAIAQPMANDSSSSLSLSLSSDKPPHTPPKNGQKKTPKKFTPPTLEDVVKYFVENGYTAESGKKAWGYYDAGGWKDSSGKPVKAWKQKMISVWFRDEHKAKAKEPEGSPYRKL